MLKKYPFYMKATVILFGMVLFSYIILNLKAILVPISFGLLLAVLLNPFVNLLQKWKLNHVVSISVGLVIAIVLIAAIGYFLSLQIASFSDQMPVFKKKSLELLQNLQHGISREFNLNV